MNPCARILAGRLNDVLWLRIEGRGSFQISPQLNRFVSERMAEGIVHFVVDLEECPAMDSTFMGTLTGIAVRLQQNPGGRLQVVNPNDRNRQLLGNLGLDNIFEVDADGRTWVDERRMISRQLHEKPADGEPSCRREQAQCMLEAHENLARASEGNVPRFHDVIECLRREMAKTPTA